MPAPPRDVSWYRERDAFVAGWFRGVLVAAAIVFVVAMLEEWC